MNTGNPDNKSEKLKTGGDELQSKVRGTEKSLVSKFRSAADLVFGAFQRLSEGASSDSPRDKQKPTLLIQTLEEKTVFAANLVGGVLEITGTNNDDQITVFESGKEIVYVHRGIEHQRFDALLVDSLKISSGGGDDRVVNKTKLTAKIFGGSGDDLLIGGAGRDFIYGQLGKDDLRGRAGDDILHGGKDDDRLLGSAGNDLLIGAHGKDFMLGHAGDDRVRGGSGNDKILGGSGNDHLEGGNGNDEITGQAGHDKIFGDAGNDVLRGSSHDDDVYGGLGDDRLLGGGGDDILHGGKGDDILHGGKGDDQLFGDNGRDMLAGGNGNDELSGGLEDDLILFPGKEFDVIDRVMDSLGSDTLEFSNDAMEVPFVNSPGIYHLGNQHWISIEANFDEPESLRRIDQTGEIVETSLDNAGRQIEEVWRVDGSYSRTMWDHDGTRHRQIFVQDKLSSDEFISFSDNSTVRVETHFGDDFQIKTTTQDGTIIAKETWFEAGTYTRETYGENGSSVVEKLERVPNKDTYVIVESVTRDEFGSEIKTVYEVAGEENSVVEEHRTLANGNKQVTYWNTNKAARENLNLPPNLLADIDGNNKIRISSENGQQLYEVWNEIDPATNDYRYYSPTALDASGNRAMEMWEKGRLVGESSFDVGGNRRFTIQINEKRFDYVYSNSGLDKVTQITWTEEDRIERAVIRGREQPDGSIIYDQEFIGEVWTNFDPATQSFTTHSIRKGFAKYDETGKAVLDEDKPFHREVFQNGKLTERRISDEDGSSLLEFLQDNGYWHEITGDGNGNVRWSTTHPDGGGRRSYISDGEWKFAEDFQSNGRYDVATDFHVVEQFQRDLEHAKKSINESLGNNLRQMEKQLLNPILNGRAAAISKLENGIDDAWESYHEKTEEAANFASFKVRSIRDRIAEQTQPGGILGGASDKAAQAEKDIRGMFSLFGDLPGWARNEINHWNDWYQDEIKHLASTREATIESIQTKIEKVRSDFDREIDKVKKVDIVRETQKIRKHWNEVYTRTINELIAVKNDAIEKLVSSARDLDKKFAGVFDVNLDLPAIDLGRLGTSDWSDFKAGIGSIGNWANDTFNDGLSAVRSGIKNSMDYVSPRLEGFADWAAQELSNGGDTIAERATAASDWFADRDPFTWYERATEQIYRIEVERIDNTSVGIFASLSNINRGGKLRAVEFLATKDGQTSRIDYIPTAKTHGGISKSVTYDAIFEVDEPDSYEFSVRLKDLRNGWYETETGSPLSLPMRQDRQTVFYDSKEDPFHSNNRSPSGTTSVESETANYEKSTNEKIRGFELPYVLSSAGVSRNEDGKLILEFDMVEVTDETEVTLEFSQVNELGQQLNERGETFADFQKRIGDAIEHQQKLKSWFGDFETWFEINYGYSLQEYFNQTLINQEGGIIPVDSEFNVENVIKVVDGAVDSYWGGEVGDPEKTWEEAMDLYRKASRAENQIAVLTNSTPFKNVKKTIVVRGDQIQDGVVLEKHIDVQSRNLGWSAKAVVKEGPNSKPYEAKFERTLNSKFFSTIHKRLDGIREVAKVFRAEKEQQGQLEKLEKIRQHAFLRGVGEAFEISREQAEGLLGAYPGVGLFFQAGNTYVYAKEGNLAKAATSGINVLMEVLTMGWSQKKLGDLGSKIGEIIPFGNSGSKVIRLEPDQLSRLPAEMFVEVLKTGMSQFLDKTANPSEPKERP